MRYRPYIPLLFLLAFALAGVGCDADITGTPFDNQPPNTDLSVRDTSLVDNLEGGIRLSSTVLVAWTGTDPDGFVKAFEVRFFDRGEVLGPEERWQYTVRNDSLMLLPIPRGDRAADVVVEVRAIDNEDLTDPTPARTIFPIQNAPPTITFSPFELPPDTTFGVFSIAWRADDPEGLENLARIDVSFNDSTTFVGLPPDVDLATFVSVETPGTGGPDVVEAMVFTGRAFQRSELRVPGLRLDAENTIYIRAVDQTDTTSVLQRFTWHVKRQRGEVLYVNDFRKASFPVVQAYHLSVLRDYLPAGTGVDVWDVSQPFVSGSAGNTPRSNALPPSADPTLRQLLARYRYIYWVSTNATNSIQGNNLPFAAGAMDLFFDAGGKMMVHTPISLPSDPEDNLGNAAILLLPLTDLITFPDTLRPSLRMPTGFAVTPVGTLPGVTEPLPALEAAAFVINTLPYIAGGTNTIPLYEAEYNYITRVGGRQGPWPGSATVASLSTDRRVGLFALPLVNEQTGAALFTGADGDGDAARRTVWLMLESLGFPKR